MLFFSFILYDEVCEEMYLLLFFFEELYYVVVFNGDYCGDCLVLEFGFRDLGFNMIRGDVDYYVLEMEILWGVIEDDKDNYCFDLWDIVGDDIVVQ